MVSGCVGLARLRRLGSGAVRDPGEYPEDYERLAQGYLNVLRVPNVDRKYRKRESKYERVII